MVVYLAPYLNADYHAPPAHLLTTFHPDVGATSHTLCTAELLLG